MGKLSEFLLSIRAEMDRSKRWVERQSKELYPDQRDRQISNSYLGQLEDGSQDKPSPAKLQTLAEIYGVEYRQLLEAVGYLEDGSSVVREDLGEYEIKDAQEVADLELAIKLIQKLRSVNINPGYFINGIVGLAEDSLQLVSRLVTTLSVQGKNRKKNGASEDVIEESEGLGDG